MVHICLRIFSLILILTTLKSHQHCSKLKKSKCRKRDYCQWEYNYRYRKGGKCYAKDDYKQSYNDQERPRNLILFLADGFGSNYNAAYRLFADLESTLFDDYHVGITSVFAFNKTVPDSAASATAYCTGQEAVNNFVGLDTKGNPVATILEASKLAGKGVGSVSNTRVTHATPASCGAHSFVRGYINLIAEQQGTRLTEYDVLFGGGRRNFLPQSDPDSRRTDDFDLPTDFEKFGWNSYIETKDELFDLDEYDLPSVGLFTASHFPSALNRRFEPELQDIPSLKDMTQQALKLLSKAFDEEGFILLIEPGQGDFCGHSNDVVCMLYEVDEYHNTVDYVINDFIKKRREDLGYDDTLVVMVSDHETGGFSLGRASHFKAESIVLALDGPQTPYRDTVNFQTENSFKFDPLLGPPTEFVKDIRQTNLYDFFVEPAFYPTRTAGFVAGEIEDILVENDNFTEVFKIIEDFYIEILTEFEKSFIVWCYNSDPDFIEDRLYRDPFRQCIVKILSMRMNAGWTTHGHTGGDQLISAFGPSKHKLSGYNTNIGVGNILIDVFGIRKYINKRNKQLKELFLDDRLQLCDPAQPLNAMGYQEGESVPWPRGNFKFPGFCAQNIMPPS